MNYLPIVQVSSAPPTQTLAIQLLALDEALQRWQQEGAIVDRGSLLPRTLHLLPLEGTYGDSVCPDLDPIPPPRACRHMICARTPRASQGKSWIDELALQMLKSLIDEAGKNNGALAIFTKTVDTLTQNGLSVQFYMRAATALAQQIDR